MIKKSIKLGITFFFITNSFATDINKQVFFLDLCSEFWDLDRPLPSPEEYSFFRPYVAQSSGPILEPMCGTGRFLIPFLEEGFDVEGFDASSFMFNKLRKKCEEKNLSPRIWKQFLEVVPETKQYNLIFIPDTSFAIFTDLSFVRKCLRKIYSLLQPGGTFVFDIQTIYSRWGEIGVWTKKAHKRSDGKTIVESSLPLPIQDRLSTLMLRYELLDNDKIIKAETEPYEIRLYGPTEMDALLKEVGFREIKRMKAYDRTKIPSAKEETIVYECIK